MDVQKYRQGARDNQQECLTLIAELKQNKAETIKALKTPEITEGQTKRLTALAAQIDEEITKTEDLYQRFGKLADYKEESSFLSKTRGAGTDRISRRWND